MEPKRQHKEAARIEKRWETEARKDAIYNKTQARRDQTIGDHILEHLHNREEN
jgi:hypothetical protein